MSDNIHDEVKYTYHERRFTWDDRKAVINREKHAVTFRLAEQAFADPDALGLEDHSADEERWNLIGKVQKRRRLLLFVVYVQRTLDAEGNPIYRIISARKASTREEENYYDSPG